MKLLTKALHAKLLANGHESAATDNTDHYPVVKFFSPVGAATWLITEIDPGNEDHAFGLCDVGLGFPELGYVSLRELASIQLRFGLGIERDLHFKANKTIGAYADEARAAGGIRA